MAGNYLVSLVASDGTDDSTVDRVRIIVSESGDDTNNAPVAKAGSDQMVETGSNVNLDGTASSDEDGDALTYSWLFASIPSGSSVSLSSSRSSSPSFTADADGTYVVQLTVNDSTTDSSVDQVNITAQTIASNSGPTANAGSDQSITLGSEKSGCGAGANIDNPWRYDPMSSLNSFRTDEHNAHTKSDGAYHYHGNPLAMYDIDCENSGSASPVIGFAADGFPVYGKCFDDNGVIREAKSSYVLKDDGGPRQDVDGYETPVEGEGDVASSNYDGQFRGDWEYSEGEGDLDECNGMTVNGQYGYYVTDAFPWLVGCLTGSLDSSFEQTGERLIDLMHSHDHHLHEEQHAHGHSHKH